MAIVSWPDDVGHRRPVLCVVCKEVKPFSELTAGWCDTEGCQEFACDEHFRSSEQFIVGWADFMSAERFVSPRIDASGYEIPVH